MIVFASLLPAAFSSFFLPRCCCTCCDVLLPRDAFGCCHPNTFSLRLNGEEDEDDNIEEEIPAAADDDDDVLIAGLL